MDIQTQNFIVAILGIVIGAVLGGGTVLIVLLNIVKKVKSDPITLDYLEKLYQSIPTEVVRDLLRDLSIIGGKITDGLPNEQP